MEERLPRECWKCGRLLDDSNTSPIVYTSNPPKYACTTCDSGFVDFVKTMKARGEFPESTKTELTEKEKPVEYKPTTEIKLNRSKGDLTVSDLVEIGAL